MRGGARVDVLMYFRALPMLFAHPTILAMPVLAAVVDWGLSELSPLLTNAVGGAGAGLFAAIGQVVYLYAFGVAVIQASHVWRGRRATFDEAWEEARRKGAGILTAAIGFIFVLSVAGFAAQLIGATLGLFLELVAAFFLIYTIPAASIGGLPSQLALSGSITAVRNNVFGAGVLAIVFVLLWVVLPTWILYVPMGNNPTTVLLVIAGVRALVLAYLAFPFAKQYDDVAFRGF